MLIPVLTFIGLSLIIIAAGTVLAITADLLAEATGLGKLLVGSILLAGVTSLPELTVDYFSIKNGMYDLALGDILGSGLMNLMILAILDLTRYSKGVMLSKQAAAHCLAGLSTILLTGIIGIALLTKSLTMDMSFLGLGIWSWVIIIVYIFGIRLVYFDQMFAKSQVPATEKNAHDPQFTWKHGTGFILSALVIVVTGPYLSHAAGQIADLSGMGKTFIGTTLVALSTSLPELVTSLVALRMGSWNLVIGNIFGSNAFNILIIPMLDAALPGSILSQMSPAHVLSVITLICATVIILMGQLYQVERRRSFIEPDGWLVILTVLGGLFLIYKMG